METKFDKSLYEIIQYFGNLNDKTILEVGCDQRGDLIKQIAKNYKPLRMIGINLRVNNIEIAHNASIEKGDIRGTRFDDNYFDYIYSIATFEHVFNLNIAIDEMFRVLKPGGLLYAKFGPIWSSCWGHHLWFKKQDQTITYHNTPLPPFCHLLMNPEELRSSLLPSYSAELIDSIIDYVYNSPDQNRLFFEDYEKIIYSSSFRTLIFSANTNFPLSIDYKPDNYLDTLLKLQSKYPGYHKFYYPSINLLLQKV